MKDFTVGKTYPQLINYAIPLILGNFFQLTYNAVDSIILGRFAGKECLASVGIANPVMNIMIFLISNLRLYFYTRLKIKIKNLRNIIPYILNVPIT